MCLVTCGKASDALKCLESADRILSDGPEAEASGTAWSQETAAKVYYDVTGLDVDDPEVKARFVAAAVALQRMERERADAASMSEHAAKAKLSESQARLKRRTRRDP